ncbi:MAG: error-prone DNA polymerase [Proteobacteria bacterium]|jgi:error-prone DNA polymerase|nr:error-prone DNA polymerase [Pseudomonadota bacterium]
MAYVELLARTHFSLLDGASEPQALFEAAARADISHLGVADRDCVYGLVQAHTAAKDTRVALICGASITVEARSSVVLLAQDHTGWTQLCRLLTQARANEPKGLARVPVSVLAAHNQGLTCVLRYGWNAVAAAPLRDAFGDRLEIALSCTLSPTDRQRIKWAKALSQELALPMVATNDAIYAQPTDRQLGDVLNCIRRRSTLEAAGRALRANGERHLLPEAEFRQRYRDFPKAIHRGHQVAERCSFSLDQLHYQYPGEVVPDQWSPIAWLTHLTHQGLKKRYPQGVPQVVHQQVLRELTIIEELKFPAYFLTVFDIVRFARQRHILCQGRGSAANSAVCYALGITSVDPARSSLLFERFISAERGEPPDIDVDFEHERREEVIQYIYQRYGRKRAALVNEVISYRSRSAIRQVGKVFGLSLDQVDRLSKSTDRWSAGQNVTTDELVREAGLDPEADNIKNTLEYAAQLKGCPRHLSIHVGGFVIAEGELTNLVPVEPAAMKDRTVIQWDKYDVDALNFVKVDVLGLGMLTAIRKGFELVKGFWGKSFTLATIPPEDPQVYEMFCKADTVGVFQIESRAQMSMLPRLKPRCFYDLVIEVAIVRPGPIQGGMVHPYLRRRNGEEPVTYAHPALKPILERTLGVPLFQEQVMAMAVAVGGFSPGQADQLRRAMGAWRKRGTLQEIGRRLVENMIERGIDESYANAIFEQIKGFGEYGFPESHAASFALLVYVSGWLKYHYPAAFVAALINSQPMGFYSPRALVADLQRHGAEVRSVCVNNSIWNCTLESTESGEAALRLGFRLLKGFGEDHGKSIVAARQRCSFANLPDFARRTHLDRGKLQLLAQAGTFVDFEANRRRAAWILQGLWTDLPLFSSLSRQEPAPELPLEGPTQALQAEYRSMGLSVDRHPVRQIRPRLQGLGAMPMASLATHPPGARIRIAGMVSSRQRPGTASGVVFMTLEDETGLTNLVVWPRTWSRFRRLARNSTLLGVDGQLQRQGDAISVVVEHFWTVEEAPEISVKSRNFR